jgi:hypothetical protein
MTTPEERKAAERSIAEEQRELEDVQREITKIYELGDTPYGGKASDRIAERERAAARIKNNLKGKQEVLDNPNVTLSDLISREETELEELRADRKKQAEKSDADALKRANEKVRDAEEVQDGKRHVRDSMIPRPGAPQEVELGFYGPAGQRLLSLTLTMAGAASFRSPEVSAANADPLELTAAEVSRRPGSQEG